MKKIPLFLFIIILISACSQKTERPPEQQQLANPASVYCEEQGGTLDIRSDEQGNQNGVCVFDDGTECEEWAYYRGECG